MTRVARVKWLSGFDLEPLLSAVLSGGMLISVGLMITGLMVSRVIGPGDIVYQIHAISLPRLLQADLRRVGSQEFWGRFLIDLGFSVLLLTPYVRLVITWLYLAFVKSRWRYAAYTSVILVLLTLMMFSDVVLAPGIGGALRWYPFKG